jgi:hypothetical protein
VKLEEPSDYARTDTLDTPAPDTTWLMPAEAAAILKVHPRTVGKWALAGKITGVQRTLGGHRRYDGPEIRGLAAALKAAA